MTAGASGGVPIEGNLGYPASPSNDAITKEGADGVMFEGRDLACIRGDRVVFEGLDFTAAEGTALWLKGPNGSGKSSLLRLAAGLMHPAAGRITWTDDDIAKNREAHRTRLAYVGHLDAMKPTLTAAENLTFWAGITSAASATDRGAIGAALERFGLTALADVPNRLLSAGERRRANLARLAVTAVPLWLLDEPTVALDEASIAAFAELITRHLEGGGIALIAAHAALEIGAMPVLDLGQRRQRDAA